MVPLEVTHRALATQEVMHRLRTSGRSVATAVAGLLDFFGESYRQVFGFSAPPVHDPCAVAAVIDPTIVRTAPMYVAIEVMSELSTGRTICDVHGQMAKPANALVGYDLDVPRFWEMVLAALLSYE
jgi:inosine-uridine nucleoside N-ribohydrolase